MLPCRGRGTGSTPVGTASGPVVQRPRRPFHMRETMVRVHAGSLFENGLLVQFGKTPASRVGNRGSSPRRSTDTDGHEPRPRAARGSHVASTWINVSQPDSPPGGGELIQVTRRLSWLRQRDP